MCHSHRVCVCAFYVFINHRIFPLRQRVEPKLLLLPPQSLLVILLGPIFRSLLYPPRPGIPACPDKSQHLPVRPAVAADWHFGSACVARACRAHAPVVRWKYDLFETFTQILAIKRAGAKARQQKQKRTKKIFYWSRNSAFPYADFKAKERGGVCMFVGVPVRAH